jgi:hypothetical protein
MSDTVVRWGFGTLLALALAGIFVPTCAEQPRANCYTCVERCHPFRVSACEPAWSRLQPLYCACDPFTRVDEVPATIGPVKGGK